MLTSSDEPKDNNNEEEVISAPIDLTRVHEQAVEQLDDKTEDDDDELDADNEEPNGTTPPKKSDVDDDDEPGSGDDDDDEDADDKDGEDDEDDDDAPATPPTSPKPTVPDQPIELDTDTTKDGHGKIAVKDYDGKTHYFNNMEEVPDDFEPASYKEWGTAVDRFTRKAISDERAADDRKIREQQAEQQAEIDDVTKRWTSEQESMRKSGDLPKDDQEYETEVAETLIYMGKQLDKGNIIESFEAAHKARKYDEGKSRRAENDKKRGEVRKKRGGTVMGGSGGQSSKKGKSEPLPPGTSLDAVHARYSGLR